MKTGKQEISSLQCNIEQTKTKQTLLSSNNNCSEDEHKERERNVFRYWTICRCSYSRCSFVCLEFIVPLENFTFIWRRHICRWRAADFDLCSALIASDQFFNSLACQMYTYSNTRHPFILVISEDPLHAHLTLTTCKRFVATRSQTPIFRISKKRSTNCTTMVCLC